MVKYIILLLLLHVLASLAESGKAYAKSPKPWEAYILSPKSRTASNPLVRSVSGNSSTTVASSTNGQQAFTLQNGTQLTLDFGVEIGGLCSFNAITAANSSSTTTTDPHLSLAFAESPSFIRPISDDTGSTPSQDWDQALDITLPPGPSLYTMPSERFRGGFRFVTVTAHAAVTVSNFSCHIGFAPGMADLRAYSGHFYTPRAQDEVLVRAWYAGAYTTQTNVAAQNTGRWLPQVRPGWAYNNSVGVGAPILLDGAKRDRAVWPGDLGIAGLSAFLSLGDEGTSAVYNALETLFAYQNGTTGLLPFAGPATGSFRNGARSDTYHAWGLVAMYNYAVFTADEAWVERHWGNITRGLEYIVGALESNDAGLHDQIYPNDWARQGGGGYNSALNALDYHCLTSFASLATSSIPTTANATTKERLRAAQAQAWTRAAQRLKASFNALLWDPAASLYGDNQTAAGAALHPQDGNALAVLFNVTTSRAQAAAISEALTRNWNAIGPVTPELPDTISPFVSGVEVLAHFQAGEARRALALVRRTWGYLLDSPLMTGSTLAEGLSANGSLYYRSTAGYKYDASYTSLSHSWSTGPTPALMAWAVGLELVGWRTWRFGPRPGELREVDGGFDSPLGRFGAEWKLDDTGRLDGVLETPDGTEGVVELPWTCEWVSLDGKTWSGAGKVKGGRRKVIKGLGCR